MLRFGTAVREFRNQLGISQEHLAERAGLDRTYVGHVERGARNVSLSTIEKLAHALGIPASNLMRSVMDPDRPVRARETGAHAPVEIVIVDHDPQTVKATVRAFHQARVENSIVALPDANEALEYLFATGRYAQRDINHRPRVVFLDLSLPPPGAIAVLRRMKQDQRCASIPVIMMAHSERDKDLPAVRRLGADAYVIKPLDIYRLPQLVGNLNFEWRLVQTLSNTAPLAPRWNA